MWESKKATKDSSNFKTYYTILACILSGLFSKYKTDIPTSYEKSLHPPKIDWMWLISFNF